MHNEIQYEDTDQAVPYIPTVDAIVSKLQMVHRYQADQCTQQTYSTFKDAAPQADAQRKVCRHCHFMVATNTMTENREGQQGHRVSCLEELLVRHSGYTLS